MPNKEGGFAPNFTPTCVTDESGVVIDVDVCNTVNESGETLPSSDLEHANKASTLWNVVGSTHSASEQQGISVRRSTDGLTSIVINDVQIEIAEVVSGPDVAKQYLLRQFSGADRDRNGYLEEDESSRNNAFRLSFDQFDVDGDGKLFKEELTAVVDGRTQPRANECA